MKKLLLTFILVIGIIFGFMMVTSYAYYAFENGSTVFDTTTYNEDINISYETSEYISVSNAIPIEDKYASSKASQIDLVLQLIM